MIIVDDEHEIRQGLKNADYASLNIEVVDVCENGLEALKSMDQSPVDILLTDIKMPLMDGLELIQKVSQRHPYTKKIVLSGYGDFEYAKRGIEYGVLDYLLKPLDFEDYYGVLAKTTAILNEEREKLLRQANLERKAKLSAHLLRKNFLGELLRSSLTEETIELDSASAEVMLEMDGTYAVCVLRFQSHPPRPSYDKDSEWGLIVFTLDNLLQDLWDENGYGYHYVDPYNGQCALIVANAEWIGSLEAGRTDLEGELDRIVKALRRFRGLFKSHLAYTIGPIVHRATRIRHSYLDAEFKFEDGPANEEAVRVVSENPSAGNETKTGQTNGKRMVLEVKRFIEHNYDRTITLDDVAKHVHLNASYLSYLFKEITGMNYIDYVTEFRIEKAKTILSESNWKIYEVGEMVGYENPRYFTLIFKKYTGQTPLEYRNTTYKSHAKDG
ncbi:response regulator [Paenibacillus mendelii]|nr:response regulator [Paenibacillus mendelii]